jgi:hypothetical protein
MSDPDLPHGLDPQESPILASHARGLMKNFPPKIPRNPLISLDSDERIQGNLGKSNPHKKGFHSEMGSFQENPN